MRRQSRIVSSLLAIACASSGASAARKFNIHDDLLAFPQFDVDFSEGFILDSQARAYLEQHPHDPHKRDEYEQAPLKAESHDSTTDETNEDEVKLSYEELILEDHRFLCQIPVVKDENTNQTKPEVNEDEEKKELARATDRGLELLGEMEGKCLYYISGWWSYSFCYMNQIKQFHALPSGGGIPSYPPMEDHTTHSFILGRFSREDGKDPKEKKNEAKPEKTTTDLAELQTRGGSRYLVQHLDTGDECDLTGKSRKIEVQFHCNPQSTDRIAWIKELSICSYLMLIYTPRLCNDVAFLPPQEEATHTIECRQILTPDKVSEWQAMHEHYESQKLVEAAKKPEYAIVGGIEVGAQRLVGTEGKRIEKGRVASIGEEKVDVVAKRENGEVKFLSVEDLKKFDLDPEKVESLKKKLEEWAKGKDWTLEMVTGHGEHPFLRGVVDKEDDDEEPKEEKTNKQQKDDTKGIEGQPAEKQKEQVLEKEDREEEGGEESPNEEDIGGSEETYKDEL